MIAEAPAQRKQTIAGETPAGRFERICAGHGARTAITFGDRQVSYAELALAAGRVAEELTRLGAGPGTLVAIELERGVEMIASMLGVAMTGAAYLPLDPAYPEARRQETLDDARPLALISAEGIGAREGWLALDERAAYVIYTSGSTGKPKGVVVSRDNLLALLDGTAGWFGFGPDDVWTMFHSFAFDFSVWEMWGALLTGGRLVVVPFALSRSPGEFYELLQREQVTVLNQTPSAFALVDAVDASRRAKLALRLVIFGGEALSFASLRGWMARHGERQPELVNMYGITETTVHVTYRRIREADLEERESLIGVAIPGLTLELLDAGLQPVRAEEEGEICVGGTGVALGYLRRPELTAERFVQGLYRSGDMARVRADGELVYLGRRDSQVKIAGFRIELGEVEAALLRCPGVEQACALVWQERLVGFVRGATNDTEVATHMATHVPAHLRPALYRPVQVLPLTVNGKVDRTSLAAQLDAEASSADTSSAAQPGALLEQVRAIWQQALGLRSVGLDQNFFDVGGTSLLLVRVREALKTALGREIPVVWMFEATTVRTLAARLGAGAAEKTDAVAENARKARMAFGRARAARGAQ